LARRCAAPVVLGQVKIADKSNEIVAIPKLLELLAIEGAVVTLDAIGCQRAIVEQNIDKKADYVLALKGNQGTLREDEELFVAEQKAKGFFKDAKVSQHETVDGDHGRIETRTYTGAPQWLGVSIGGLMTLGIPVGLLVTRRRLRAHWPLRAPRQY